MAAWYSGVLVISSGKKLARGPDNWVDMGYGKVFKRYLLVSIQNGIVTNTKELSAKQFLALRDSKRELYRGTEEFRKKFNELKNKVSVMDKR